MMSKTEKVQRCPFRQDPDVCHLAHQKRQEESRTYPFTVIFYQSAADFSKWAYSMLDASLRGT
jgi:hypothetical protein